MTPRLVVDLGAFTDNVDAVRRTVHPAELMLVVKDDAYGHGLEHIVPAATAADVQRFVAYSVQTGLEARHWAGADARVLVLLAAEPGELDDALAAGLELGVGSERLLGAVVAAGARTGVRPVVHLKVDTGLHRNGVRPEDWAAFVARAAALQSDGELVVGGIWSHIAEASDADDDVARAAYDEACAIARAAGLTPSVRHLAASAAAFARPEFRYDLVRIGAFCYGIRPAGGPAEAALGIRPIASLRADVVEVEHDSVRIGIGSLHGLPSTLGGRVEIATPGGRCSLLRVGAYESEVAPWPGAAVGDEVIVHGAAPAQSATDLAEAIDTIGEEIALRVNPLVPRVYLEGR